MADTKISALDAITSAEDDDVLPIVQSGVTYKIAVSNLILEASATVKGKVELATAAETTAGTDANRAVTPSVLPLQVQDSKYVYAADAEASDTYVITLTPAPSAYAAGQVFHFKANTVNTGAATLNVNGLGAKTIKKQNDTDLADNDIESGQIVTVVYDGTNFQMQSQIANATAGGTTDGWLTLVASGTRSSDFVMTAAGDFTGTIQKGDKIKLTDTTTKYFYVKSISYGAPNSTITFVGTTDYALVGNPSTIEYSKHENPQGFPRWFNFAGAVTGYGSPTANYKFAIQGGIVQVQITISGTSNATSHSLTLPINCELGVRYPIYTINSSTSDIGRGNTGAGSSTLTMHRDPDGNAWTSGVENTMQIGIGYLMD